jgi:hypothetical protein
LSSTIKLLPRVDNDDMTTQKRHLESSIAVVFKIATLVDIPGDLVHSRGRISPMRQVSGNTVPEGVGTYHSL